MGGVINPDYFLTGSGTGGSGLTGGGRFAFDRAVLAQARAALRTLRPHRERPAQTAPPAASTHPRKPAPKPQRTPAPAVEQPREASVWTAAPSRALLGVTAVAAVVAGAWQLWRWRRAVR